MCSVSKEPVTRVTMDNIFLILDFHYVKFNVSLCFFTFPSLFLVFVSSGCRCPEGQLLQDGRCVPVTECRCGIPSGNGTLEFLPEEEFTVDCNAWWELLSVSWSMVIVGINKAVFQIFVAFSSEICSVSLLVTPLRVQCVWEWHCGVLQASLSSLWALESLERLLSFMWARPENQDAPLPGHRGRPALCRSHANSNLWSAIVSRSDIEKISSQDPEILPASLASPYLLNLCLTRRLSLQRVVCWVSGRPGASAAPPVTVGCHCGTRRSFESQSPVGQPVSGHLNSTLSVTPTAACPVTQAHNTVHFVCLLRNTTWVQMMWNCCQSAHQSPNEWCLQLY